jgi:hypothetical protein
MLTFAKGITNGAAPMGGVLVRDTIHDAFMSGPEHVVELTHGYTYSAHPLACAAALATLDIYRDEKLFERAKQAGAEIRRRRDVAAKRAQCGGHPHRRLTAASTSRRARRAGQARLRRLNSAFHDNDLMLRVAGDTLALTPPLIVTEDQIGEIVDKVAKVIRACYGVSCPDAAALLAAAEPDQVDGGPLAGPSAERDDPGGTRNFETSTFTRQDIVSCGEDTTCRASSGVLRAGSRSNSTRSSGDRSICATGPTATGTAHPMPSPPAVVCRAIF